MPTSKSTTWIEPGAPSQLELDLQQLAGRVLQQVYGSYDALGSLGLENAAATPAISEDLRKLIETAQAGSLANAQAGLRNTYGDIETQIASEAARRGVLDSSFTAVATGSALRDQALNFANLASNSQQQTAQQLFSGAFQQQGNALQLLQLQNQMGQLLSDPGLLGRMMQFRLATARQTTSGKQTGTDWGALFGDLAKSASTAYSGYAMAGKKGG
mgnify:CR=1 FL=1